MAEIKHLGRIKLIHIGAGGYQGACFGVSVTLSFDGSSTVGDFKGNWTTYPEHGAEYSREDWERRHAETWTWLRNLMASAKVDDFNELNGKPVEITMDAMRLQSWRILTEVL